MKKLASVMAAAMLTTGTAGASLITFFDFGTTTPLPTTLSPREEADGVDASVEWGGTNMLDDGYLGTSYVHPDVNDGDSVAAGRALGWSGGLTGGDNSWILTIDATGWLEMSMRFDERATSTGPSDYVLQYRVGDDESWTLLANRSTGQLGAWSVVSLSLPSAMDNEDNVQIRGVDFTGGSGTGTYRVDNVHISGIPEPGTIGLLLGTGLMLMARRRKR